MLSSRRRASSDFASAAWCSAKAACVCARSDFRRAFSCWRAATLMRRFNHMGVGPAIRKKAPSHSAARNLIERFFNKTKEFRRIATRYDKLAENYLAALKLVAIRIWLRAYESTS
jgi:hypothetical protein